MSDTRQEFRKRAERDPIGVDLSDYSDEYVAGFLAGQVNLLDVLADPETYSYVGAPLRLTEALGHDCLGRSAPSPIRPAAPSYSAYMPSLGEGFRGLWRRLRSTRMKRRKRLSITSRKVVFAIPGGEIQYGRISKRLAVWWRGRRLI